MVGARTCSLIEQITRESFIQINREGIIGKGNGTSQGMGWGLCVDCPGNNAESCLARTDRTVYLREEGKYPGEVHQGPMRMAWNAGVRSVSCILER